MGKPFILAQLATLISSSLAIAEVPDVIKFNRDVRPIFSSKCFQCHGPSEKDRKAKLRFDLKESAFADRDGVRAVVAGKLDASELWSRINAKSKDEVMPPPKSKKELTSEMGGTLVFPDRE